MIRRRPSTLYTFTYTERPDPGRFALTRFKVSKESLLPTERGEKKTVTPVRKRFSQRDSNDNDLLGAAAQDDSRGSPYRNGWPGKRESDNERVVKQFQNLVEDSWERGWNSLSSPSSPIKPVRGYYSNEDTANRDLKTTPNRLRQGSDKSSRPFIENWDVHRDIKVLPYFEAIPPNGLEVDRAIIVEGELDRNRRQNLTVTLLSDKEPTSTEIERLQVQIMHNENDFECLVHSYIDEKWDNLEFVETPNRFDDGKFRLKILPKDLCFEISLQDDKLMNYQHRFKDQPFRYYLIDGEIDVSDITFRKEVYHRAPMVWTFDRAEESFCSIL